MNIEDGVIKAKAILDNHREIDKMMVIEMVELVETLLTAYEKEKEKNMKLTNSYNQAIKETNEENRRCMLLAVENQDLKEKNKRLRKCHLQYEEMTGIDLLLPEKEEKNNVK